MYHFLQPASISVVLSEQH